MKNLLLPLLVLLIGWILQAFAMPFVEAVARGWDRFYTLGLSREERTLLAGNNEDHRQLFKKDLLAQGYRVEHIAVRLAGEVLRGAWGNIAWRWHKDVGALAGGAPRASYVWLLSPRVARVFSVLSAAWWGIQAAVTLLSVTVPPWILVALALPAVLTFPFMLANGVEATRILYTTRQLRRAWPDERQGIARLRAACGDDVPLKELRTLYRYTTWHYKDRCYRHERDRMISRSIPFRDLWRVQSAQDLVIAGEHNEDSGEHGGRGEAA